MGNEVGAKAGDPSSRPGERMPTPLHPNCTSCWATFIGNRRFSQMPNRNTGKPWPYGPEDSRRPVWFSHWRCLPVQTDEALNVAQAALEKNPDDPELNAVMGEILCVQRRLCRGGTVPQEGSEHQAGIGSSSARAARKGVCRDKPHAGSDRGVQAWLLRRQGRASALPDCPALFEGRRPGFCQAGLCRVRSNAAGRVDHGQPLLMQQGRTTPSLNRRRLRSYASTAAMSPDCPQGRKNAWRLTNVNSKYLALLFIHRCLQRMGRE